MMCRDLNDYPAVAAFTGRSGVKRVWHDLPGMDMRCGFDKSSSSSQQSASNQQTTVQGGAGATNVAGAGATQRNISGNSGIALSSAQNQTVGTINVESSDPATVAAALDTVSQATANSLEGQVVTSEAAIAGETTNNANALATAAEATNGVVSVANTALASNVAVEQTALGGVIANDNSAFQSIDYLSNAVAQGQQAAAEDVSDVAQGVSGTTTVEEIPVNTGSIGSGRSYGGGTNLTNIYYIVGIAGGLLALYYFTKKGKLL